jgi:hypothetical protein
LLHHPRTRFLHRNYAPSAPRSAYLKWITMTDTVLEPFKITHANSHMKTWAVYGLSH